MFVALAVMSSLYHLRTFLLMPKMNIPQNASGLSLFKSSFIGQMFNKEVAVGEEKMSEKSDVWLTLKQGSAINPRIPGIPGISGIETLIWDSF